jgi:hypothetical protein
MMGAVPLGDVSFAALADSDLLQVPECSLWDPLEVKLKTATVRYFQLIKAQRHIASQPSSKSTDVITGSLSLVFSVLGFQNLLPEE